MSPSVVDTESRATPMLDPGDHRHEIDGRSIFLSTAPAKRSDRRLAAAVVGLSALGFAVAVPYAQTPLAAMPAFIPGYEATLVVGDFVTALLLFGQFSILRSRALLALAGGYLFCALIAIAHALTFPGLFSPSGLLGAGSQSTAWLYMFWHGGFPLAVLAYAGLERPVGAGDGSRDSTQRSDGRIALTCVIAAVIGAVCGLTWLATAAEAMLPAIMVGDGYTPAMMAVVSATWLFSLFGLAALWTRRPHSVLDLWLAVVLCAWLFDVALSAVFNHGRYDLGWYAGRLYGLLAASFVLAVMLVETTRLYGRLSAAATQLADYARALEARVHERTLELRRTNDELHRNHALLAAIFRSSPIGIYLLDIDGKVMMWNPSAERIFGFSEAECLGRIPPFVDSEHLAEFQDNFARMSHGESPIGVELRRRRKDGSPVDISLAWAALRDDHQGFTGIIHAVIDVTERRLVEEKFLQAQKMEAVGQLTGGIAHDFNNLLGVIVGNLDLLHEQVVGDADVVELVNEALGAALKGADVTRQLLAFSRRQRLQPKRVAPNDIVRGISKLLGRAIGEPIEVRLDLPEDAWPVVVDPTQLESSILNLAVNARDAMPHGGTLTIETANLALDAEEAEAYVDGATGDYVMIAVSDTGTGMAPEITARAFEPFFSTKAVGKGTGLGLSMVYGFAKQSGGNAKIYSEPGIGTTIRLYLPRAADDVEIPRISAPQVVSTGGGERILVVEDNEALRRLAQRQLDGLGYRTVTAATGAEALAHLTNDRTIDLLFTDIVMPGGIDGRELAQRARVLRPGLKILFTSGFTAVAASTSIAADLSDKLISKPFRKGELAHRVRTVLDRPAVAQPANSD